MTHQRWQEALHQDDTNITRIILNIHITNMTIITTTMISGSVTLFPMSWKLLNTNTHTLVDILISEVSSCENSY